MRPMFILEGSKLPPCGPCAANGSSVDMANNAVKKNDFCMVLFMFVG